MKKKFVFNTAVLVCIALFAWPAQIFGRDLADINTRITSLNSCLKVIVHVDRQLSSVIQDPDKPGLDQDQLDTFIQLFSGVASFAKNESLHAPTSSEYKALYRDFTETVDKIEPAILQPPAPVLNPPIIAPSNFQLVP